MELFNKTILTMLFLSILQLLTNFISEDLFSVFGKEGFLEKIRYYVGSNYFHHFQDYDNKRNLNTFDYFSNTSEIFDQNVTDYGYQNSYYFLNNITSYQYIGTWKSLLLSDFKEKTGQLLVSISKNNSSIRNFVENIENYEVLYLSILLYDGDYIDHWMNFTFNIHLAKNFSQNVNSTEEITIENAISLTRIMGEFNDQINFTSKICFNLACDNSKISLKFNRKPVYSINNVNFTTDAIEFSELKGVLQSVDCLFDIDFELQIKNDEKNHVRIWNYSLILSSIAMVEIYLTLKLIYAVSENSTLGKNVK